MEVTTFENIDLSHVRTVFSDLDNTLYSYEPCHKLALEGCYNEFLKLNTPLSSEDFKKLYTAARKEVTKRLSPQGACRSRFLGFLKIFEDLGFPSAFILAQKFDDLYWQTFCDSMKIDEKALQFLQKCKGLNIKVCLVTDMISGIQVRKIKALGIEEYIHALVTSEECGAEKPHPQMFETALRKMNASISTSIFIGDDFEKDIVGSRKLNMTNYMVKLND